MAQSQNAYVAHSPLSRVKIADPACDTSPMTTVYEQHSQQQHQFSQSTVLNTAEHMQAVIEMFGEHVEFCGEPFKEEILKKVLELKGRDY